MSHEVIRVDGAGRTADEGAGPVQAPDGPVDEGYRADGTPDGPADEPDGADRTADEGYTNSRTPGGPADEADPLVSAASAVAAELLGEGVPLSRDRLAERLRGRGHSVSTARAGQLVRAVRTS